ncbi:hypothetical protein D3C83_254270 [compost metagenome]
MVEVKLSAKLEVWVDGTPAKLSELRPGDAVKAHGSKLPGGGFVARELMVHHPGPDAQPTAPTEPKE